MNVRAVVGEGELDSNQKFDSLMQRQTALNSGFKTQMQL